MNINYQILADSVEYYTGENFTQVDVPWWVSRGVAKATLPEGKTTDNDYYLPINDKVLVASGEQSLLYLAAKGTLPPGRYQTITPCFRNECHDFSHRKHFMKNELMILFDPKQDYDVDVDVDVDVELNVIGLSAMVFFEKYLSKHHLKLVPKGKFTGDINFVFNDVEVELGSYGFRKVGGITWVYGTGCAEPRLSYCLNILN